MAASSAPPAWRTLLTAAADEWRATPFYRVMLRGADADRVTQWGLDPRLGDAEKGREILAGRWRIAAEKMAGTWPLPWSAPPPSPHFAARLHSFSWLIHVNAVGPEAQEQVAALIQSWVSGFGDWHPQAWAPELVGERLSPGCAMAAPRLRLAMSPTAPPCCAASAGKPAICNSPPPICANP
jgi:uncharacterized heparinase superfamily protein